MLYVIIKNKTKKVKLKFLKFILTTSLPSSRSIRKGPTNNPTSQAMHWYIFQLFNFNYRVSQKSGFDHIPIVKILQYWLHTRLIFSPIGRLMATSFWRRIFDINLPITLKIMYQPRNTSSKFFAIVRFIATTTFQNMFI